MSYTNNLDNTLLMLNINTKLPLTPDDYWLRNSRLEATFTSRLNTSIRPDLPRKLSNKFLGPYELLALPGTYSVTLRLPDSLCTVHPVFHVSMLEPATPNPNPNQIQPPPLPIIVDDKLEFEISEILDSKIDN